MLKVLAFGCHPDDIEFMCAGTLALLKQKGCEIHLATMTGGECGSKDLRPQEIRAKRLKEAQNSADVLGAGYHYAGGADLEIEYVLHYRQLTTRVIRQVRPDIVLTNPPVDYLADHEMTSLLVRNACFVAPVMNFDAGSGVEPTAKVPTLYYWSAMGQVDWFGNPVQLHFGIDIAGTIETKTKMLQCHESQKAWLQYINGWDEYTRNMIAESKRMGAMFGVELAEGFTQHLGAAYPHDNLLAELLGGKCIKAKNR